MKRGKKFLILLGVLAVLLGAAAAAPLLTPEEQPAQEPEAVTVFSVEPEQLSGISWTLEEQTLSFGIGDDGWYYVDDAVFPVEGSTLEEMKEALLEIVAEKVIDAPEEPENYGLLRPACTVTVTAGDETRQLQIGDTSAVDGLRYLSVGDGKVYLVDSSLYDRFNYGLYDLVAMETVPEMEGITECVVETAEQTLTLEYRENSGIAYSDSYVWFAREGGELLAADTELTESFLSAITGLDWESCVEYNADGEALKGYGLDAAAVTVTVGYGDSGEQSFSVEMGLTDDGCYARLPGSGMVYEIDSALAEGLLYTTYMELQPDEVLRMDWDTVETVTAELEGESYTFLRQLKEVTDGDGNVTREAVYLLGEEELALQDILDTVEAMASTGYANGAAPQRNPELRLVFTTTGETFSEICLTFCRHDSSSCLVQLNGESTLFVSREDVVALKEAITALVLD